MAFFFALASTGLAFPQRLVIALDGISYRDAKALQAGVGFTNFWGGVSRRQAFGTNEGYFPVSRMISTFPSTSDVAWTDIFGDRPEPGYQRTYYSTAANAEVYVNGLTSTIEHERQMDWEADNNFIRAMGYVYSAETFQYELRELVDTFWNTSNTNRDFYIYIRSSDDAQHMDQDIMAMLMTLDRNLQNLRARYRAREGHDLEILILSDHGHNHAGRGERVQIKPFLENAGYRVTESIENPKDVVLPTSGIEDWIEIHSAPEETERMAESLIHLKGADIITARLPDQPNHFLVLNPKGERAVIQWNPQKNTFKYSAENGDPLDYNPVATALAQKGRLDADGFATADDWASETMADHYPLALQRIARGLTSVTLDPATILVSLDNRYVNAGWLVNEGSKLESCGSTHGALDDINSTGILLNNFTPTPDTSTERVAGLFDNFPGLRDYHKEENGAEWVSRAEQATTRIPRDAFDRGYQSLPDNGVFLRVWSPELALADNHTPMDATIGRLTGINDPAVTRVNLQPRVTHETQVTFSEPISLSENSPYERVYAFPSGLNLAPQTAYRISGWLHGSGKDKSIFELDFRTDAQGKPLPY